MIAKVRSASGRYMTTIAGAPVADAADAVADAAANDTPSPSPAATTGGDDAGAIAQARPLPSHPHQMKKRPPRPPRFHIVELELQKLHKLDVANQSFAATLWMDMVIRDGAKDPNLSAKGKVFPIDPKTGKPTFQPSAEWFLGQIDCRNALKFSVVDSKVMRSTRPGCDDLHCAIRVEGEFTEVFELADYPFDVQGLTMTVRTTGPLPPVALSPVSTKHTNTHTRTHACTYARTHTHTHSR